MESLLNKYKNKGNITLSQTRRDQRRMAIMQEFDGLKPRLNHCLPEDLETMIHFLNQTRTIMLTRMSGRIVELPNNPLCGKQFYARHHRKAARSLSDWWKMWNVTGTRESPTSKLVAVKMAVAAIWKSHRQGTRYHLTDDRSLQAPIHWLRQKRTAPVTQETRAVMRLLAAQ